jgi:hypothetical protein
MVICILAVLIGGAAIVGILASLGNTWGPNWPNGELNYFDFDQSVGSTTGTVLLDVDVDAVSVSVIFENDTDLLYEIDVGVSNRTLEEHGDPTVTFSSNTITLDYPAAEVNITLGTGVVYELDIVSSTGTVSVVLSNSAQISDVSMETDAGTLSLVVLDDIEISGSPDFNLQAVAGSISVTADLPAGIGGSIEGSSSAGAVSITAPDWDEITPSHYESSDYDTASQKVTIVLVTSAGTISATIL